MDIKPRPNHQRYLEILRAMTPAQRLDKAMELTEHGRSLMKATIARRHAGASESELHALYLERLKRCHNQNY